MIKTRLALASMLLILAPIANVSAGTLNDDFNTTLQVNAFCSFTQPANDVSTTHGAVGYSYQGNLISQVGVTCNVGLPYTLEVDSSGGGAIVLTDGATSKTLAATVWIWKAGNSDPIVPWGQIANGEEFPYIGDGTNNLFGIQIKYSNGRQPAGGVYTRTNNITLTF